VAVSGFLSIQVIKIVSDTVGSNVGPERLLGPQSFSEDMPDRDALLAEQATSFGTEMIAFSEPGRFGLRRAGTEPRARRLRR
jgi:hypothetical protein